MRNSPLLAYLVSGGVTVSSPTVHAKVTISRGAARFHSLKGGRAASSFNDGYGSDCGPPCIVRKSAAVGGKRPLRGAGSTAKLPNVRNRDLRVEQAASWA